MQRHLLSSRATKPSPPGNARRKTFPPRRLTGFFMKNVLLTGAAGDIGTRLRKLLKGVYPALRLSDIRRPADLSPDEDFVQGDLADYTAVEKMVGGIEGVIHLGGFSVEGPWQTILDANIIGAYNRYGVSKAFGEAIGSFYADKHGLGVTCIRIGNVSDRPIDLRRLSIWLKPEDLVQLIRIGLEHPDIHFEIFYGASDNAAAWWDNSNARRFGYKPTGVAETFRNEAEAAQANLTPDPVGDRYQGGTFCSDEYDANRRS
jgi:uronate dehydrogenase